MDIDKIIEAIARRVDISNDCQHTSLVDLGKMIKVNKVILLQN